MKTRQTTTLATPKGWHAPAQDYWVKGDVSKAIEVLLKHINSFGQDKPAELMLQFAYYLFLIKDYNSAIQILEIQAAKTPDHVPTIQNLAISLSRVQRYNEAISLSKKILRLDPDNIVIHDLLASALGRTGHETESVEIGTQALILKDQAAIKPNRRWRLPEGSPADFTDTKCKVIAFSLWGKDIRYLRGALHNVILAKDFYADWEIRFHVDGSVPTQFVSLIEDLGAKIIMETTNQSTRQKLCWRFKVSEDPSVGYFLVRDADSIFSAREVLAVEEWLCSGRWFHVIRDWWTHTDPMLAGLWGGVAGILPPLTDLLQKYSSELMETPNIDQWFLRDQVWGYVRQSCMVHDRCFRTENSIPLPGKVPDGLAHIGQNEFAARPEEQATFLKEWIAQYPCLSNE